MNQSCASALQVGKGGSIRIIRADGKRVTFKVTGVNLGVPAAEVVEAIKTVFGEGSQPKTEWPQSNVPDYIFCRYINEPIKSLDGLNMATQRIFMRIVNHFQTDQPGPIDTCG